jgi:hypothetical protein
MPSLLELWMWSAVLLWISRREAQQTPDSARAQLPQALSHAGQLQPSVVLPRRAGGYNPPHAPAPKLLRAVPPLLALMSRVHPQTSRCHSTSRTSPARRPPSTQVQFVPSPSVPPQPAALLPPPSPTPAAPNHCLRARPPTLTPTLPMCSYGLSKRF